MKKEYNYQWSCEDCLFIPCKNELSTEDNSQMTDHPIKWVTYWIHDSIREFS